MRLVILETEMVRLGGGEGTCLYFCASKFVDVQYEGFYAVLLVVRGNYSKRCHRHVELFITDALM